MFSAVTQLLAVWLYLSGLLVLTWVWLCCLVTPQSLVCRPLHGSISWERRPSPPPPSCFCPSTQIPRSASRELLCASPAWSQRPSENASSQHSGAGGPRALLVHSDMWNLFCCSTHVRALSASSLERIPVMKVLYTQRAWVHMSQMRVCQAHKASLLINKWWRPSQWTLWVVLALMSEIIFDMEQQASFCVAVSRQWPSIILLRPFLKPQLAESDQLLFVFLKFWQY